MSHWQASLVLLFLYELNQSHCHSLSPMHTIHGLQSSPHCRIPESDWGSCLPSWVFNLAILQQLVHGSCLHLPTKGTLCNWHKQERNLFQGCWVIARISRKLGDLAFKSVCLETRPMKSIINHIQIASHLQCGHQWRIDGTLDTNHLILISLELPLLSHSTALRSQPCLYDSFAFSQSTLEQLLCN